MRLRAHRHTDLGDEEICCDDLHLRHQFSRYHRFFIFSPLFLMFILALAFLLIKGDLPRQFYGLFIVIVMIVAFKELVSVFISKRIYNHILKPVEDLKKGLFEVSRGNCGVEVAMSHAPEITDLVKAFNDMSQKLKASDAEKIKYEENRKALIASISHDLKTPITSINGFVEGILEGVADTEEKRLSYIHIIQQNARYMNRLIDDLTLYSKLDLHKLNFECVLMSFGDYISELFFELKLENEESGVEMYFEDHLKASRSIRLDPKQMARAIRNIVANALTYGRQEGAQIRFRLTQDEDAGFLRLGYGIMDQAYQKIKSLKYLKDFIEGTMPELWLLEAVALVWL